MSPQAEHRGDLPAQLLAASRTIERQVQGRLLRLGYGGVRTGHLALLLNLERSGARATELAQRAGITKQSMGDLVRELERLDFVERRGDPRDGRAVLILPTGRGLMLIAHLRQAVGEVEAEAARRLGAPRFTELRGALAALASAEVTEGRPETGLRAAQSDGR